MANKKGEDKVSIANYLAIFGLATIGVITFFGSMFDSKDGKPTEAIIIAVLAVFLLGGTLMGAIKAKSAENDPGKWKFVEWLCIVAYLVIVFLFMTPFVRFFYVAGEKEKLQEMAKEEIGYVTNLHNDYDTQRREAISQANQMLIEFNGSGKRSYDTHLQNIAKDHDWETTTLEMTDVPVSTKVTNLETRIHQWDLFDISKMAYDMDGLEEESYNRLKEKIKEYGEENKLIPVISGSAYGGEFKIVGLADFNLPEPQKSNFTSAVRTDDGFSVLGFSIYVVLNLIILLSVWVTRRSNYVEPRRNNDVGGTAL